MRLLIRLILRQYCSYHKLLDGISLNFTSFGFFAFNICIIEVSIPHSLLKYDKKTPNENSSILYIFATLWIDNKSRYLYTVVFIHTMHHLELQWLWLWVTFDITDTRQLGSSHKSHSPLLGWNYTVFVEVRIWRDEKRGAKANE